MLAADWETCVAGPRSGQRGLPPHRRLRRLHRGRRRGRHEAGDVPLRHPVHGAARGRLDRGPGGGDGPVVDRAGRAQLGEPGRGRRARYPARLLPHPGQGVRGRRGLHLYRHRGPGPDGRLEGPWPPPSTTSPSNVTACGPTTSCSMPWPCPSPPGWRRAGGTASRRSRGSGGSRPSCPASSPWWACPTSPSG